MIINSKMFSPADGMAEIEISIFGHVRAPVVRQPCCHPVRGGARFSVLDGANFTFHGFNFACNPPLFMVSTHQNLKIGPVSAQNRPLRRFLAKPTLLQPPCRAHISGYAGAKRAFHGCNSTCNPPLFVVSPHQMPANGPPAPGNAPRHHLAQPNTARANFLCGPMACLSAAKNLVSGGPIPHATPHFLWFPPTRMAPGGPQPPKTGRAYFSRCTQPPRTGHYTTPLADIEKAGRAGPFSCTLCMCLRPGGVFCTLRTPGRAFAWGFTEGVCCCSAI